MSVIALLGSTALGAGQTVGAATGSVVGSVREATGGILADVTITIAGDALMSVRTAISAADGSFRIAALPPGEYTVSFSLRGFKTHHHRVSVSLAVTTTIDVQLPLAALEERLTITARGGVLDPQSTAITKTFHAQQLADLPGSRSTSALFAAAQAVATTVTEIGGSVAAIGSSSGAYGTRGSNRPTIEGILVSGIGFNGLTLDYGSVEQASVLTGSHGAEWATPGVHVQVVTKSGGNQYRGTLYGDYENRHWQSVNVDRDQIERGAQRGAGLPASDANRLWSYRDANADVGGFIVRNRLWWFSSFRDQQISTRLVNFPARPHRTSLTNYSGKGTYRIAPGHTAVAYVQTARNHQPNDLDAFGPGGGALSAATAINVTENSTADQHASGLIWKTEWQDIVHDRLLLELRVGQFGAQSRWDPYSTAARFEDTQTRLVSGGNRASQSQLRRAQAVANVSYFKDGWMGGHHFRVGGEATRSLAGETLREGYPGNVLHVLRNGAPAEVYLFDAPSKSTNGLWTYAAHATDSWRLHDRLALNLGVRFDGYRVFLPEQEHPAGSPAARRFLAVVMALYPLRPWVSACTSSRCRTLRLESPWDAALLHRDRETSAAELERRSRLAVDQTEHHVEQRPGGNRRRQELEGPRRAARCGRREGRARTGVRNLEAQERRRRGIGRRPRRRPERALANAIRSERPSDLGGTLDEVGGVGLRLLDADDNVGGERRHRDRLRRHTDTAGARACHCADG